MVGKYVGGAGEAGMKAIIIAIIIFVIAAVLDGVFAKQNPCDTCQNRFCVSNQHPTICDDCQNGSNYKNWLEQEGE